MKLDINYVRNQFPAFSEPSLQGQAFFENAGGSYPCRNVIDRLIRFYQQRKVQPYGASDPSRLGGEEMDEARTKLASWMGVEEDEVSFGPSTTQNTYVLAQAFRQHLSPGDSIIVTNQDHEANTGPWRRLEDNGIIVREWQVDPKTGHLDLQELTKLLDGTVKLVCFPHCSNIVAEINPVAEIVKLIHEAGAKACVDGVSYAPHGLPNLAALGADIYLFSSYKTYGPHQGIMVIRRGLAEILPNQGHYFNAGHLDKRFTPAGPDHAQIAATAGMIDYFDQLYQHHASGHDRPVDRCDVVHALMRDHECALLQPLLDYFSAHNQARLLGPAEADIRAPTVTVSLPEPAEAIAARLANHGIMAAGGDFYGVRVIQAMEENPSHGVLRMSFVHYTSKDEIDKLIHVLDREL